MHFLLSSSSKACQKKLDGNTASKRVRGIEERQERERDRERGRKAVEERKTNFSGLRAVQTDRRTDGQTDGQGEVTHGETGRQTRTHHRQTDG